jgi:hypothetical protein
MKLARLAGPRPPDADGLGVQFEEISRRALGYGVNPRGTQLFAVMLTFVVVAWVFIGLRLYVRIIMIKKMAIDDWLMIFSVVRLSLS